MLFYCVILNAQNNSNVTVTIDTPITICNILDCNTLYANYLVVHETNDYTVSSIPFNYNYSENSSAINISLIDDSYYHLALPFTFYFYGNSYSGLDVGANGLVSFDTHIPNVVNSCPWQIVYSIPNSNFSVKNAIYGVYQDINPELNPLGKVSYQTIGVAPNRKFIITFNDVFNYACGTSSGLQSSQIILHETSNFIDVNVKRRNPCITWNNGNGIIGIQNSTGTMALTPLNRNTGNWVALSESWRFTPNGNSITQFQWFKDAIAIGNANPITLCGNQFTTGNEIYTAKVTYNYTTPVEISASTNLPVVPIPNFQEPINMLFCNEVNATHVVDLTSNTSVVLQNVNSLEYEITYYISAIDSQNFTNPIVNPTSYNFTDSQTIYVSILNVNTGCAYFKFFSIQINEPVSLPLGPNLQLYISGQTLNDLNVVGTNLKWYDSLTGGNSLPNSSTLQNNQTYFVSQSINGCESNRLAITVSSNLDINLFSDVILSVFPNPVDKYLIISSNTNLTTIELSNAVGQIIFSKFMNANEANVDMSNLENGIYFLKLYYKDAFKTIKIIKQ